MSLRDWNEELVNAAERGDIDLIRTILEQTQGRIIIAEVQDRFGKTPLWHAAANGHTELVRLLLDRGARVNPPLVVGRHESTPLFAAIVGEVSNNEDTVQLLLKRGADMEALSSFGNSDNMSPLFGAMQMNKVNIVRILQKEGLDITQGRYSGHWISDDGSIGAEDWTPLHAASSKDDDRQKMIEFLLEHGADMEAETDQGWTPLHVASYQGCLKVVEFLLDRGANIEAQTNMGETPHDVASAEGHHGVAELLRSRMLGPQLYNASQEGNVALAKELIAKGASVMWKEDEDGAETPLHVAFVEGDHELFKVLLEHCDRIDAVKNEQGATLLHIASNVGCDELELSNEHRDIIQMVLDKGANIDAQDNDGNTPLHYECSSSDVNVHLVQYFVEQGASISIRNLKGETPLDCARTMAEEAFIDNGTFERLTKLLEG